MNKEEINNHANQLFQLGLRAYLEQKDKNPQLATFILIYTSKLADLWLITFKIWESYEKVYCPSCKTQIKTGWDIQFMKDIGECIGCDHIRSEKTAEDAMLAQEEVN